MISLLWQADKNEKASFYGRILIKIIVRYQKSETGLFNYNVEIENGDVMDDLNDKKFDKIFYELPIWNAIKKSSRNRLYPRTL